MALDTKVTDRQQDNTKTISLRLWRGIYTHTKFQLNPPKHFQDMAPDTKTDGQPDRQPDNAKTISLRLRRGIYTHTKKKLCPPLEAMFLNHDIIVTHCMTKFHEDRTINVASTTYTEKGPASRAHVFEPTGTIFELAQDIIGTNHLTKFHDDGQYTGTIFELVQDIIGKIVLTKFHDVWTVNVASRLFTR
ncbi:hypothetical protein DPMN_057042 [Dreissena polymorpha]|uniref:Uncharacterized protein n=1 Tax=Dreissena polymorpha TaxID=45954 RepID=A0A9D4HS20_DREPO|nr:hypothetical protein DPMN_057042 [Dreissena polymorpha]